MRLWKKMYRVEFYAISDPSYAPLKEHRKVQSVFVIAKSKEAAKNKFARYFSPGYPGSDSLHWKILGIEIKGVMEAWTVIS